MQDRASRPATFFGIMATLAAHRAILEGRHGDLAPSNTNHDDLFMDLDYKVMKNAAYVATRQEIAKQGIAVGVILDACAMLVCAAVMIGNFGEARTHLISIKSIISTTNDPSVLSPWVPLVDMSVSIGTLAKPLLVLPWNPTPIADDFLQRIVPQAQSPLARLGSSFADIETLSFRLRSLLGLAEIVCYICEYNATHSAGLNTDEHETLRRKSLELQYQLLTYPFEVFPAFHNDSDKLRIPEIEEITRLAILGLLSRTVISILPSCGTGRALTHHQWSATQAWLRLQPPAPDPGTMKLVVWALVISVHCAEGQPELPLFMRALVRFAGTCGLASWQDAEDLVMGYIYMPASLRNPWSKIWTSVQSDS